MQKASMDQHDSLAPPPSHILIRYRLQSCSFNDKKKRKFSSYIRNFRREQLQSHTGIWLTVSSNMTKYLRISSYIRKLFLIYEFATDPIWISWKKEDKEKNLNSSLRRLSLPKIFQLTRQPSTALNWKVGLRPPSFTTFGWIPYHVWDLAVPLEQNLHCY